MPFPLPRDPRRPFGASSLLPAGLLVAIYGLGLGTGVEAAASGLPRGIAVAGSEALEALLPPGVAIESYENHGYSLVVDGRRASVTVDASPLGSREEFSLPSGRRAARTSSSPSVRRLARSVTAGAHDRFEAVSRILAWVSSNVDYRLDRSLPQDAESVLRRRDAYCTGAARLTVALLQAVEIPAREVAGLVLDGASEVPQFHRWIEAHYGDVGWVFSDPLATHHYVPVTYLPLASSRVEVGPGLRGEVLRHRQGLVPVDLYPGTPPAIRARRNDQRQMAAALTIATGGRRGEASILGSGLLRTRPLEEGRVTFLGLEPGRYEIRVRIAGGAQLQGYVDFEDRERRSVVLPLQTPADERRGSAEEVASRQGRTR